MASTHEERSRLARERMLRFYANGGKSGMLGKHQSERQKQAIRNVNKRKFEEGTLFGGTHWSQTSKRDEIIKELSRNHMGRKGYRKGMTNSLSHRKHQSESIKGWTSRATPERLSEWKRKIKLARAKQVFPFEDTKIEIALRDELTKRAIGFTTHAVLFGRPDIFLGPKICVFADGDYWHANPLEYNATDLIRHGTGLWTAEKLWAYDKLVTETLEAQGYKVFRFWGREVEQSPGACIDKILTYLQRSAITV